MNLFSSLLFGVKQLSIVKTRKHITMFLQRPYQYCKSNFNNKNSTTIVYCIQTKLKMSEMHNKKFGENIC